RKLDGGLQSLDDALGPQDVSTERPHKRPHLVHTLYSTLAKYGIKTKESAPSLISPNTHLDAILSRAAAKTRKAFPNKFRSPTPMGSSPTASYEYRLSSTQNLLERLATYKLNTFANQLSAIDAITTAKYGRANDGKDRLVCGICKVSRVFAGREGINRDAASLLVEKQRVQSIEMHKDGCPWKKRRCDG
ncbi:hypothetical protein V8E53_009329, partial [Lactarius tabidus]